MQLDRWQMNESIFKGELGMKAFDRRLFKNVR